ncbi:hypothetical protein [Streptomyces griseus]|uniref:hypothetical protein n=1 Tax=Streptomyces griseus TaxID=1911 RepID=UPI0037A60737
MPDTSPTPADQLRAAAGHAPSPELARLLATLADASDHHPTGEGGVVATLVHPALAVARQLLGTSTDEDGRRCVCGDPIEWMSHPDESGWIHSPGSDTRCLDARPAAAPPAPAAATLAEVWTVWREDKPIHGHFATVDAARQGTIDCWQDDEPVCPDYSWRPDGPRLELVVGGEGGGVYASRHRVYGAPPAPADRTPLRDRIRRAVCEAEGFAWDTDMLEPDEYGEVADAVLAVLADDAAAGVRWPNDEDPEL